VDVPDDGEEAHTPALAVCPGHRINAACFCPAVQTIRVGNLPVQLCLCCGGLPA